MNASDTGSHSDPSSPLDRLAYHGTAKEGSEGDLVPEIKVGQLWRGMHSTNTDTVVIVLGIDAASETVSGTEHRNGGFTHFRMYPTHALREYFGLLEDLP